MTSTIGRMPVMAAPTPRPTNPASEIGVSITRSGPNSLTRPLSTLNGVPASATSSPIRKTRSSRRISSAIASRIASPMVSWRSATACSRIDMHRDLVRVRVRRLEGEAHTLLDLGSDLLLDAVERGGVGLTGGDEGLGEDLQRVALLAPGSLLVLGPVVGPVDVAHMVAALPVGPEQEEGRPLAGPRPRDRGARRVVHAAHVLPVALVAGDAERLRALREVAGGRLQVVGVLVVEVVLADVDHGQLPQRRHVHHLVQEALAQRALAEKADRDLVRAALLGREGRPGRDAGAAADD